MQENFLHHAPISQAKRQIASLSLERHAPDPAIDRVITRWTNSPQSMACLIEHTKLARDNGDQPSVDDITQLCKEAKDQKFFAVCVNRDLVKKAHELLEGSNCKVVTVIDFPDGTKSIQEKEQQVASALAARADELDMVINVPALKNKEYRKVYDEIRAVVRAAGKSPVKVILETGRLTEEETIYGCLLAKQAGAHFVKTSTGFGPRGAAIEDIWIMRECVGGSMGIKAAGGISTYDFAHALVLAGANRIGASKSLAIVNSASSALTSKKPDELKLALDHARDLFVYHAGQRLTSLNFFLAAVGFVIGGTATALSKLSDNDPLTRCFLGVVSATVLILSVFFWILDKRNEYLVHCDEAAMKKCERELAVSTGLAELNTILNSDVYPSSITYRRIMPMLFILFILLGMIGIVFSYLDWNKPQPTAPNPHQGSSLNINASPTTHN
jgi:deoxyribose-phosphate aldolase